MEPRKRRAAQAGGTDNGPSSNSTPRVSTLSSQPSDSVAIRRPSATLRPVTYSMGSRSPRKTRSMTAAQATGSPILSGDGTWASNQDHGASVQSTPTKRFRSENNIIILGSPALSETASLVMTSSSSRYFDALSRADEEEQQEKEEELGEFYLFPKLPGEVQNMIWKIAVNNPRIVGLKPEKVPAVVQACHNSRSLAQFHFRIYDFKTGILINPETDILHLDESSFAQEIAYHNCGLHTLRCNRVPKDTFLPVERVSFSIQEVMRVWSGQCFHCFLNRKMPYYFPNIKELIIIVRPGPLGSGYEDLYETTPGDGRTHVSSIMRQIEVMFGHAQDTPDSKIVWKNVTLKFMRMEKWAK